MSIDSYTGEHPIVESDRETSHSTESEMENSTVHSQSTTESVDHNLSNEGQSTDTQSTSQETSDYCESSQITHPNSPHSGSYSNSPSLSPSNKSNQVNQPPSASADKWDFPSLMLKYVDLQAECAFHKARFERAVSKVVKEKDEHIKQLLSQFEASTELRRQAFKQMKDKLTQSVQIINQYKERDEQQQQVVSQLRSQLTDSQKQVNELRSQQSISKTNYQQSLNQSMLETETLKNELRTMHTNFASSQLELAELRSQVDELKSRDSHHAINQSSPSAPSITQSISNNQASSEGCVIRIQSTRGASSTKVDESRLLPQSLETGMRLAFKWTLSGKVTLQWFRSFCGSQWRPISGVNATKPSYVASVDDIGACLRAEATHLSDERVVYAECGPIYPSMALMHSLNDPLKKFECTFTVESASSSDSGDKSRKIVLHKDKVKLQDSKGKTTLKHEWNDAFRARLDDSNDRGFTVRLDKNSLVYKYTASDARQRDLIVCSLRIFNYIITTQHGKLSKENDHLLALVCHVRAFNERMHILPLSTIARHEHSITSTPLQSSAASPSSIIRHASNEHAIEESRGRGRTPRMHARTVSFSEKVDWRLADSPENSSKHRSSNQTTDRTTSISADPFSLINTASPTAQQSTKSKPNLRVTV